MISQSWTILKLAGAVLFLFALVLLTVLIAYIYKKCRTHSAFRKRKPNTLLSYHRTYDFNHCENMTESEFTVDILSGNQGPLNVPKTPFGEKQLGFETFTPKKNNMSTSDPIEDTNAMRTGSTFQSLSLPCLPCKIMAKPTKEKNCTTPSTQSQPSISHTDCNSSKFRTTKILETFHNNGTGNLSKIPRYSKCTTSFNPPQLNEKSKSFLDQFNELPNELAVNSTANHATICGDDYTKLEEIEFPIYHGKDNPLTEILLAPLVHNGSNTLKLNATVSIEGGLCTKNRLEANYVDGQFGPQGSLCRFKLDATDNFIAGMTSAEINPRVKHCTDQCNVPPETVINAKPAYKIQIGRNSTFCNVDTDSEDSDSISMGSYEPTKTSTYLTESNLYTTELNTDGDNTYEIDRLANKIEDECEIKISKSLNSQKTTTSCTNVVRNTIVQPETNSSCAVQPYIDNYSLRVYSVPDNEYYSNDIQAGQVYAAFSPNQPQNYINYDLHEARNANLLASTRFNFFPEAFHETVYFPLAIDESVMSANISTVEEKRFSSAVCINATRPDKYENADVLYNYPQGISGKESINQRGKQGEPKKSLLQTLKEHLKNSGK